MRPIGSVKAVQALVNSGRSERVDRAQSAYAAPVRRPVKLAVSALHHRALRRVAVVAARRPEAINDFEHTFLGELKYRAFVECAPDKGRAVKIAIRGRNQRRDARPRQIRHHRIRRRRHSDLVGHRNTPLCHAVNIPVRSHNRRRPGIPAIGAVAEPVERRHRPRRRDLEYLSIAARAVEPRSFRKNSRPSPASDQRPGQSRPPHRNNGSRSRCRQSPALPPPSHPPETTMAWCCRPANPAPAPAGWHTRITPGRLRQIVEITVSLSLRHGRQYHESPHRDIQQHPSFIFFICPLCTPTNYCAKCRRIGSPNSKKSLSARHDAFANFALPDKLFSQV